MPDVVPPKTLAFRGVRRAVEELGKLSLKTSANAPRREIEGIIQFALDQIQVSVDGAAFQPTRIVVGTREVVTRLLAEPKEIHVTPGDAFADIKQFLADNPNDRVAIKAFAEEIDQYFTDNPVID